jgi:hypothetical protein
MQSKLSAAKFFSERRAESFENIDEALLRAKSIARSSH